MSEENDDTTPSKDIKMRLPKMGNTRGRLYLSPEEIGHLWREITRKHKKFSEAKCAWCGEKKYAIEPAVYTGTFFDVDNDRHVHNMVEPYVVIYCMNCGKREEFSIYPYGLTTKGGQKSGE